MRLVVVLAVLASSLILSDCSRPNQAAYARPLPSPRLSHPVKASYAPSQRPSRKVSTTAIVSSSSLPSKKSASPSNAKLVNAPTRPEKSAQARPQIPPSGSQTASAWHYVVVDTVGNCAVVDAKPADGLKIIGDKNGYSSSEAANEEMKDAKTKCKDRVESKSESKFDAAKAKAEKVGVHELTQKDIEGLSREQIKQLRGY